MYQSLLQWLTPATPTEIRFNTQDDNAVDTFATAFSRLLNNSRTHPAQPAVILCIGTDRSTGDSLGPLIGTKLHECGFNQAAIYGTLDDPVHATNLATFIEVIKHSHPQSLTIAIDACLGRVDSIGHVTLSKGTIKPGAGVNKNLPEVGDIAVTGIVNVGGFMEHFVLQNTRLSLVMNMAKTITLGLTKGFCLHA